MKRNEKAIFSGNFIREKRGEEFSKQASLKEISNCQLSYFIIPYLADYN